MTRFLCIGAILVATLSPAAIAQRRPADPKAPPPHLLMERLNRMSPEERERLLSRVPPGRRALIQERLDKYKELPDGAKARLRDEYTLFQQLPPEKQNEVRKLFQEFSELPEERRRVMRRELQRLRDMPPRRVSARLQSEAFRVEFSDSERKILENLTSLLARHSFVP